MLFIRSDLESPSIDLGSSFNTIIASVARHFVPQLSMFRPVGLPGSVWSEYLLRRRKAFQSHL
jgi:hypothetical protein